MNRLLVLFVASVLAGDFASAVKADAPTPLGGLALTPYCQSLGYDGDILTKDQLGPNAAYDNWRCFLGTRDAPTSLYLFSMEHACKFQYGHAAIDARPTNPDDAYVHALEKKAFQKYVTDTSVLPKVELTGPSPSQKPTTPASA